MSSNFALFAAIVLATCRRRETHGNDTFLRQSRHLVTAKMKATTAALRRYRAKPRQSGWSHIKSQCWYLPRKQHKDAHVSLLEMHRIYRARSQSVCDIYLGFVKSNAIVRAASDMYQRVLTSANFSARI